MSSSSSSSSATKHRKSDPCTSSLTPQRKHRKLLKDGSGTEVWPESIENIFVQGLNAYWESPWATYSQSRGRSRWRNQFLVDYLQKNGITRSKKQVASHIQVLRNMWKGEPQYYLVAGGEEPSPETPVKLEDRSLIPLDFDEPDGNSTSSASPDFSPPELQSDFPPSPQQADNAYMVSPQVLSSKESPHASSYAQQSIFSTSLPNSLSLYPMDIAPHQFHEQMPVQHAHYSLDAYAINNAQQSYPDPSNARLLPSSRVPNPNTYPAHPPSPNRATSICLLADGMTPLSIKLDGLMSSQPAHMALALKIRLSITGLDDVRSSSSLHGFYGTISLSKVWSTSGKCITRVYTNNLCLSEEAGPLEVSNIEMGTVNVVLPESSLSRCRWLDTSIPTTITQEIVVDGEILLYLIYHLDRRNANMLPSATLLGYQNRKIGSQASSMSPHSAGSNPYHGYYPQPMASR